MSNSTDFKIKVFTAISSLLEDKSLIISDNTQLIGSSSLLSSMQLVELCLLLEDLALDIGFRFDWTSDVAMSKSRSMFRTAGTLDDEFIAQMETKK